MLRTFSLARLMVGVTSACVLCGTAVNYPILALAGAFFAPTIIVWLVMLRYTAQWRWLDVTLICVAGAILGWIILAPVAIYLLITMLVPLVPESWFEREYSLEVLMVAAAAIGMSLGPLIFGGIAFYNARRYGQPTPSDCRLDDDR